MQMEYVESRLKGCCAQVGARVPLCTKPSRARSFGNTPIQPRGSLDCGPVVCYLIERLLWEKEIEAGNWSVALAGEYRAHMAETFHEAIVGKCSS